jgi:hypothetical protein
MSSLSSRCIKGYLLVVFTVILALSAVGAPQSSKLFQGESISVRPVSSFTDNDSIIFSETFENGINGWSHSDLTNPGPTWHHDHYNSLNDTSWWSGSSSLNGYENNWLQYLVSPVIDLSDAINPTLTFNAYWATEPPTSFGQYDGWDGCNVWISLTNGNTWEILYPTSPAYTCQHLYSFGWRWEMGPNISGWAGNSGGWVPVTFNLSQYNVANVQIRFAFASDEANCRVGNPSYLGFFVDNIRVSAGTTVFLSNNASGPAIPSEFTTATGIPSGDYWAINVDQYRSPTHSWNCDDLLFLSDALISPIISLPVNMSTVMRYWVYCDMPDYDGDNDGLSDDFYYIEIADAGSPYWIPIVYDWAHNGSQVQWVERFNGYWNDFPTPTINLTPWAGHNVQLRFRTVTDGNNDGGEGEGLFLDDISLHSNPLLQNDAGPTRMIVPFPTYQGRTNLPCSVDLVNYGTHNQESVPAFWTYGGAPIALLPWPQINAADTVRKNFTWTAPQTGIYNFSAYTTLTTDENRGNDTCRAGLIEVTPNGVFELGYDHRQITYMPDFYNFNLAPGSGALVYFTPSADGIPGDLHADYAKAMFYSTGTIRMHVYSSTGIGVPGAEVYVADVPVDTNHVYPSWMHLDLSDVQYLQGGDPDFWIWLEVTSPDSKPHITGHLIDSFSEGHFFTYNGTTANTTIVNFNIRVVMTGVVGIKDEPTGKPTQFSLYSNYPNPFNGQTIILYSLPTRERVKITIYNLSGGIVATFDRGIQSPGLHEVPFESNDLCSGIYICRLQCGQSTIQQKMVLIK